MISTKQKRVEKHVIFIFINYTLYYFIAFAQTNASKEKREALF